MKGNKGYKVFKLNMSKVYDKVEWDFLEEIMKKISFAERCVGLIMACVKSVNYYVLINGQPQGEIISSKGIKQSDP